MLSQRKKHTLEILTIFLYASLLSVISYFHEPWFDEAQAWLIARDSSLFDMIWNVMRYEGHTPLWHLLLFVPAHSGMPFEPGLKLVNFIVITSAVWIFIKYSPFPLFVRLLTPFTYFIFYQYGVISRCYSLLFFMLCLIAVLFPKRNKKPFVFSILLALLGGVTAHGMMIAFGIAAAWLIEVIFSHRDDAVSFLHSFILVSKDSRFVSLIFLGAVNLVYLAILWPMPDRHTTPLNYSFTATDRIYRLLMAPIGALFLSETDTFPSTGFNSLFSLSVAAAGFCLIAVYIIWSIRRGMFYYVFLPYICLTSLMTFVYFSIHHTGIYALLILFSLWISFNNSKIYPTPDWANNLFQPPTATNNKRRSQKILFMTGLLLTLSLQIYWTFAASINDIRIAYAPYRELASFISKHEIDKYSIFDYYYLSNHQNAYFTKNTAALAYFPQNIFYNHNPNHPDLSYAAHRKLNDNNLARYLKAAGAPDFILYYKYDLPFYNELFSLSDYSPLKAFEGYYMWKDRLNPDGIVLYVRKDLLKQIPPVLNQTE